MLKLKAEPRKVKENKLFGYELQLHAHKGSGFDNWKNLKNLICERRIVQLRRTRKQIRILLFQMKKSNGVS